MKLYFSTIGIAMVLILSVNILRHTAPWYYAVIATIWCTALQFLLDGAIALVLSRCPDRWFDVENPIFRITKSERKTEQINKEHATNEP